jgi:serine/threonine protein kinase
MQVAIKTILLTPAVDQMRTIKAEVDILKKVGVCTDASCWNCGAGRCCACVARHPQRLNVLWLLLLLLLLLVQITSLRHRGFVQLKDHFIEESAVHLVMSLCAGGELFYQIAKRHKYSERDAAQVFRQLLEAVAVSRCELRDACGIVVDVDAVRLCRCCTQTASFIATSSQRTASSWSVCSARCRLSAPLSRHTTPLLQTEAVDADLVVADFGLAVDLEGADYRLGTAVGTRRCLSAPLLSLFTSLQLQCRRH